MKITKNWILPALIAAGLFLIIRPVMAQTVKTPEDVVTGTEIIDGYTQVYFENGGQRQFITSGNVNSRMPVSRGAYIAYVTDINGAGQIFLYDLKSGGKTQLTFTGTNLNPKVDEKGRVIWEGWVSDSWQIFFFDGTGIKQLTAGDTSLNPEISGEYISYGRRDITGTWRSIVYSINDDKSVNVTTGEKSRKAVIKDGEIFLGSGDNQEKFPLKVSDLFLLNLPSISESTSSADPILEELSATPSGVVEVSIASESANF